MWGARPHLIPDVCGCHVLRILVVAVCRIGDVCRRLLINHFCLIVLVLVVLKKLVAEMYVQRALSDLGMKVFLRLRLFPIDKINTCTKGSFGPAVAKVKV